MYSPTIAELRHRLLVALDATQPRDAKARWLDVENIGAAILDHHDGNLRDVTVGAVAVNGATAALAHLGAAGYVARVETGTA